MVSTNEAASNKKILVTGGAGLIGQELITQLLEQKSSVIAIYNKTPLKISSPLLKCIQCDILDVTALEGVMKDIDELYHCAGLVSFSSADEHLLYKINVEGTANIVNAALVAGVKKMLHVSSVAALGAVKDEVPMTELMQWTEQKSNSKYGKSKFLGEMEVWRGIAEGLNAVIVNPTIVLGAGDWHAGSTGIFKSVYNEFPWYSEGTAGFVDVKDVAKAMTILMQSDISAERFIISAGNKTFREVFYQIADAFNKKRPHKNVTPFIASVVWRLEAIKTKFTKQVPLVTKETAAAALAKLSFDNSKLKKYLPSFEYTDIDETIRNTCAALQQKLNIH